MVLVMVIMIISNGAGNTVENTSVFCLIQMH